MNIEDTTVLNYEDDTNFNTIFSEDESVRDIDDKTEIDFDGFVKAAMNPQSTN